ncbi:uncharacterized protein LOC116613514 [Nematostella vectensis]|uniref:uncharacterized protein LOC116613514 n=1 Tax=Nematostella vectensis TaxID=45351 RepID=UPI0020771CB6|nr:uncharacterized protein LOC116613514 [Nematostella vectensis]
MRSRGLSEEGKKEEIQERLTETLRGKTRLPALLTSRLPGNKQIEELNLQRYEVLYFEALHASMNHIKNILAELRHHVTDIDALITLNEILGIQLSKDKVRGVDYRKTLILVTTALYSKVSRNIRLLLVTLCEMCEIFYASADRRSPKMILRLHNLCWHHAIRCGTILTPPTALTYRKFFGIYFHASISHASFLLRLHSHRSTNAETFERLFEKITDITKKTWGERLEDLPSNAMLHVSAEINTKETDAVLKEEGEIIKLAKALPQMGNNTLTKDMLREYAGDWEGHLHQIADFLVPGEGEWWYETEDTVEFHDGNDEISHRNAPALHHFRSSSIPQEQSYLRESSGERELWCWDNAR